MLHKKLTFLLGPECSAPFYQLSDEFMSQSEVYGFMTPVFGSGVVYDAEPKKRLQQMQSMAQVDIGDYRIPASAFFKHHSTPISNCRVYDRGISKHMCPRSRRRLWPT